MKKLIALLVSLALIPSVLTAQEEKFFTTDRELSSSMINNVYQDSDGVIWISTEDGLNRYDGAKFTIFRNDPNDRKSLKNNYTRLAFEDSKNNLFIATIGGLQIYNRATGEFNSVPALLTDTSTTFSNVNVACMTEVEGHVIVGTAARGLFTVERSDTGFYIKSANAELRNSYIETMLYANDYLWVGTLNSGLLKLDTNLNIVSRVWFDRTNAVFSLCQANNGEIYVGTANGTLMLYNSKTDKLETVANTNNTGCSVKSMKPHNQYIILGSDGAGLLTFDTQTHSLGNNLFQLLTIDNSKAKVHSILADKQGNFWFGCFQKGVILMSAQKNQFKYAGYKSKLNNCIGSCCVMSLLQLRNGNILVGTDNDGVYKLLSSTDMKAIGHWVAGNNSVPRTTLSIFEDSRGDIYFGGYLGGLVRLNKKDNRFEKINLDGSPKPSSPSIYSIVEDAHQNIYVAAASIGIYRIDSTRRNIKLYSPQANASDPSTNSMRNAWITCLFLRDSKLYFGTYDGLGCLDLETESFIETFGANSLFNGAVVYALCDDYQGQLWIGTSAGLIRLNKNIFRSSVYNKSDGFFNNSVSSLESDAEGNIWISTNHGLSCFDIASGELSHYSADDGLQCNEFSHMASIACADGSMVFGSTSGIVSFKPTELIPDYTKPQVRIADIYLNGKPIRQGSLSDGEEIISSSLNQSDTIRLSYLNNSFIVEFTSFNFLNPERIAYSYALDDNQWTTLPRSMNSVTFNELTVGNHILQIKASNNSVDSDIQQLTIIITPPWYKTVWAFIGFLLVILLIVILLLLYVRSRYYARLQLQKLSMVEEANESKLQFFYSISHEIRTPMSLIVAPLQKLIQNENDNNQLHIFSTMLRNADRILNLINQLLDIRKIDQGQMRMHYEKTDIVGTVQDTCSLFDNQAQNKNINFTIDAPNGEILAWVDTINFDKIIVNLLSNAFKFTPANGSIQLIINTGTDKNAVLPELRQYFEITISNTGSTISAEDLNHIFERFYQAENSTTSHVFGTGLGLHLTRSLVELHHGTINVESITAENEAENMVKFIVRLPLGSAHINKNDFVFDDKTTDEQGNTDIIIPQLPEGTAASEKQVSNPLINYRVMIVEDDAEIRAYLTDELSADFHIIACEDGQVALDKLVSVAPDAIVSDIMMPEIDGITLCKKVRKHPKFNTIPFVLLTALSDTENRIEGLDVGADAYISKPFNIEELRHTLQSIIRNRNIIRNKLVGNQEQKQNEIQLDLESPDDKFIERIMKVVNDNINNPDLSVDFVAEHIGVSRVHLHRKMKLITNQTTRDFIRSRRLAYAATLLEQKRYNMTELADAVGFTNLSYFSSAFKNVYGMSPTEYAERNAK